ncbi:MAG TPA: SH3 domain-containing protein [Chloroflexota bacterium]|nr:SH3 domain-containing protein [Chloroflexota bacterium]
MGIAISQVPSRLRSVNTTESAPIHWPSAVVGLALAVFVVVGVSWMAAPRRLDRPVAMAAAEAAAPAPAAVVAPTIVPTPIPPPPTAVPEPTPVVERVKVAGTLGAGVNLRAKAGEKGQRLKSMPEGAVLEIVGTDETADGLTWRNVRDASGATGWMAGKFLTRVQP